MSLSWGRVPVGLEALKSRGAKFDTGVLECLWAISRCSRTLTATACQRAARRDCHRRRCKTEPVRWERPCQRLRFARIAPLASFYRIRVFRRLRGSACGAFALLVEVEEVQAATICGRIARATSAASC